MHHSVNKNGEQDVSASQGYDAPEPPIGIGPYDLVLMNPPFGTQRESGGVDMAFLRAGLMLCGLCCSAGFLWEHFKNCEMRDTGFSTRE